MAQRTASDWQAEEGVAALGTQETGNRGEGEAETRDAPGNDAEATDALLSLAAPRGTLDPATAETWKYRLTPPQRPTRPTATSVATGSIQRPSSDAMATTAEETPEQAGQPALEEQPAPTTMQGRRGPYRRSTLDHMICQVEGCERELASLSPYHRRYRICEMHFKLDVFVRDGRRQRFCQQCGRCHDLNAFEGSKRSCRNRLNQHNARRRKKNPAGQQGNGAQQGDKIEGGQYVGGKRGGGEMNSGSKRRATAEAAAFPTWGLGSGGASAFTPQGGARTAQVGKSGASAFGPPGRVDGDPTRRGQSSEASEGGLGQDDGGLDPGLAAPGMTGHPGTLGANDSPSGAGVAAMYPGMMAAGMSPGSNPLAAQIPLAGFPPGALGAHAGLWHPAAGLPGLPSNDPAALALQADMMSAQMAALGGHLGASMGIPPNAQHTQTVQMLQAQLLRYQYMLHAMVSGSWPGAAGNTAQLGLEGLGFPPMSAGLLGMPPGDPMLLGLGQLPGMGAISEVPADGEQQPATSGPPTGDLAAFAPGGSAEGVTDGTAATSVSPAGLLEGAVVQGEVVNPGDESNSVPNATMTPSTTAPTWRPKEEDPNLPEGEIPQAGPGTFAAPHAIDGQVATPGIGEVGAGLHSGVAALDPAAQILAPPPLGVDPSGIEGSEVKLEEQAAPVMTPDPGVALGEAIPPLPVAAGMEYAGQADVERVAVKVYGRTPENMSDEERQKFTEWISTAPVMTDATTKAGCVHMTWRAFLAPHDAGNLRENGARAFVEYLISHPDKQLSEQSVLLYIGGKSAFCRGGQLMWESELSLIPTVRDLRTSEDILAPVLPTDLPCISASYVNGMFAAVIAQVPGTLSLELKGSGLHCEGLHVFCHDGSSVLNSTVTPPIRHCCELNANHTSLHDSSSLMVDLDGLPSVGLCWLEAERGPYIGATYPLLVLPPGCESAAIELGLVLQVINNKQGQQQQQQQQELKHDFGASVLPWSSWAPSARGLVSDFGLLLRTMPLDKRPVWWESVRGKLLGFATDYALDAVAEMMMCWR
eukprot:jgi/Botrbrau1/17384/Bobra.0491s0005.1